MWFQNLVPGMEKEVADHEFEGLEALVEVVLLMVSECTRDEFQSHLLPFLRKVFPLTKCMHVSPSYPPQSREPDPMSHPRPNPQSAAATALLLQNLDILVEKTARSDVQSDVLPLILNSLETNVPELQVCILMCLIMKELHGEYIAHTEDRTDGHVYGNG